MKIRRSHFALGAGAEHVVAGSPWAAVWTFPAMIGAAFVVAWGAEAAEFLMSQGLALAILALIQTAPEFAVEAVIAWKAGKNPDMVHLAIANFTGSLRLLTGFGWPMIYAVAAFSSRRRRGKPLGRIAFQDDHAVEVLGLLPPLAYFVIIWAKGNLSLFDAAILAATYVTYLIVLLRLPPRAETLEEDEEVPAVSRWALSFTGAKRWIAVLGLFAVGGAIIVLVAEPFLNSMLGSPRASAISQFVFIQWVAPFLSEFPEKTSAFAWANRITRAPVALLNMVSSNINQWGILSGLLAVIYCISHGDTSPLPFDDFQRHEILLTILQAFLGWLFLASMSFEAYEAVGLFLAVGHPVRRALVARHDALGLLVLDRGRARASARGTQEAPRVSRRSRAHGGRRGVTPEALAADRRPRAVLDAGHGPEGEGPRRDGSRRRRLRDRRAGFPDAGFRRAAGVRRSRPDAPEYTDVAGEPGAARHDRGEVPARAARRHVRARTSSSPRARSRPSTTSARCSSIRATRSRCSRPTGSPFRRWCG